MYILFNLSYKLIYNLFKLLKYLKIINIYILISYVYFPKSNNNKVIYLS